jgi:SAM-dependent methyltransferase
VLGTNIEKLCRFVQGLYRTAAGRDDETVFAVLSDELIGDRLGRLQHGGAILHDARFLDFPSCWTCPISLRICALGVGTRTVVHQGRQQAMLQTARMNLLRCANPGLSPGGRCLGCLDESDDALTCRECGACYSVVCGVPVIKAGHREDAESWFESMYRGRSRHDDVATEYLRPEREFMDRFVAERGLKGPCLEVGCGTGCFAEIMPNYIGLEYSLSSLLADGFESAARVCGDARWLPLAAESVECVFSFNTLEHVPDVEMAFGEMDRVLRRGGFLVLKPAWHCTRYITELIPVLPFSQLKPRQRLIKALLPLLKSKIYKCATRIPARIVRRLTSSANAPLRWGRLTPYHGDAWISDADAVASIDCHEGIFYYVSRGYTCLSHPTAIRQILAGHDLVVLQKI